MSTEPKLHVPPSLAEFLVCALYESENVMVVGDGCTSKGRDKDLLRAVVYTSLGLPVPSMLNPPVSPHGPHAASDDSDRIDLLDRGVFCAFRLDSGFITIGLPNGVAGSGLTLREAIDDLDRELMAYENERNDKS